MMQKTKKWIVAALAIAFIIVLIYFLMNKPKPADDVTTLHPVDIDSSSDNEKKEKLLMNDTIPVATYRIKGAIGEAYYYLEITEHEKGRLSGRAGQDTTAYDKLIRGVKHGSSGELEVYFENYVFFKLYINSINKTWDGNFEHSTGTLGNFSFSKY